MHFKKASVILLTGLSLTACGMQNNDQVGQDRMNNNIEPIGNRTTQERTMHDGRGGFGADTTYDGTYPNPQGERNMTDSGLPGGTGDTNQMRDGNITRTPGNTGTNQTGDMGLNQTRDGGTTNQGDNNYEVADELADRITSEVDSIKRAHVLTTGRNAYVAATLNDGQSNGTDGQVSDKIEREVEEVVKDQMDGINNVYVSTNPDFVDLTTNYRNDVDRGRPVEGFFEQMGEMIQRIFPGTNNRTNNTGNTGTNR